MKYWLLAISYWFHLLATVVWLGGVLLMALTAWPAFKQATLSSNQWLKVQRRFALWVNGSLLVLLVSGFFQMTNDVNYTGFLQIDTLWAWAILLKHVAYAGLVGVTVYLQMSLYPAMERTAVLSQKRPQLAASEQEKLAQQESRLLKINLFCAATLLFFTAMATAV